MRPFFNRLTTASATAPHKKKKKKRKNEKKKLHKIPLNQIVDNTLDSCILLKVQKDNDIDVIFPPHNKKQELARVYQELTTGDIETMDSLENGATYDILDYHSTHDFFLVSYLPQIDCDDLQYGTPRYFKLENKEPLKTFLKATVTIVTLDNGFSHDFSLKSLIIRDKFVRVLWNKETKEFVVSSIIEARDVEVYESIINFV